MGASWRAARFAMVTIIAFISLVMPRSAFASEWDDVEFDGSGWGHGVGMSQYGAYGMATLGYSYEEIITHYFQGSSIGTVDPLTKLWVNLEGDFSSLDLTVAEKVAGQPAGDVTISSEVGILVAKAGATIGIDLAGTDGCTLTVTNPGQSAVALTDPATCSFDFEWYEWDTGIGEPTTKLVISGCTLADWNHTPTMQVPCQYALGMLHLRSGPGGLDLSAELLMDDYVLGISEMPYYWTEMEALKAQAVAARSYAEARRIARGDPATNSCDGWCHVKDSTLDQRYVGWGHSNTASWGTATKSTALQVVTHPDSSIGVVTTYYSSSSGGVTEHGHEKGFVSTPVEWLSAVNDSWAVDGTVWNPNASWTETVSAASIASLLGLDYLTSVRITETRPDSGSAAELEFWGINDGQSQGLTKTGSWVRFNLGLKSEYFSVSFRTPGDEMFFYRNSDGVFRYYDVNPDGKLTASILSGTGYSLGWSSITAVDLDGDTRDEMFFYRSSDGVFRYYDVNPDASLGAPIRSGSGYSKGWSSITAVDLNGDERDEMFFYRSTDGAFRYYDVNPDASLGAPIRSGTGYSLGWSSITAVDLDGDGQDEMFFYRSTDGTYRYYDVQSSGSLGSVIRSGTGYSLGWSAITAVDLDGDGQDEMFFYRDDGTFRYYDISANGTLGSPILSGSGYSSGWSSITAVDLDGHSG